MLLFDFPMFADWDYGAFTQTNVVEGNGGAACRSAEFGPYGVYAASFAVIVPGGGKTLADWLTFIRAINGFDTFKFSDPFLDAYRLSVNEAVGVGDGVTTDFPLDFRCLNAASLVVRDGVSVVTPTLMNNDAAKGSAPFLRFGVAPVVSHVITADYGFYIPVCWNGDPQLGKWFAVNGLKAQRVQVVESWSGAHRAG